MAESRFTESFSTVRLIGAVGVVLAMSLSCGGDDGPSGPGGGQSGSMTKLSADPQAVPVGTDVLSLPTVRLTDSDGNVVPGVTVTFTVTSGGGSVTGATPTTNPGGIAVVGSWTLGANPGTNTLTASSGNLSTIFTAEGLALVPATVVVGPGDLQRALIGTAVSIPPAVFITDDQDRPVPDADVTFSVLSGGGSITGAQAVTDINGLAAVGSWTLGNVAGVNELSAAISGFTDVVFKANSSDTPPRWNLELVGNATPERQPFLDSLIARWESVITGDLPDVDFTQEPFPAGTCGIGEPIGAATNPEINDVVDDMRLFFGFKNFDGPGGVLAAANICAIREWTRLPLFGSFFFDAEDFDARTDASVQTIFLHEVGHTLGFIPSLWDVMGLIENANCLSNPPKNFSDAIFTGIKAGDAFDANGGASYDGLRVPLEDGTSANTCGSKDSHWRETFFDTELMTPFAEGGGEPLSIVTIAALDDMGYTVDVNAADPFTVIVPGVPSPPQKKTAVWLGNDVRQGPIQVIRSRGQRSMTIIFRQR